MKLPSATRINARDACSILIDVASLATANTSLLFIDALAVCSPSNDCARGGGGHETQPRIKSAQTLFFLVLYSFLQARQHVRSSNKRVPTTLSVPKRRCSSRELSPREPQNMQKLRIQYAHRLRTACMTITMTMTRQHHHHQHACRNHRPKQ